MYLNTLKPASGSRQQPRRVGRGIGSGLGKTCGKGHKGQKARAGGYHKLGFEGGQMPMQRRLPKRGFTSRKAREFSEIRFSDLNRMPEGVEITMATLLEHNIINSSIKSAKLIASNDKLTRKYIIRGIKASKGAKQAVEASGGSVEV